MAFVACFGAVLRKSGPLLDGGVLRQILVGMLKAHHSLHLGCAMVVTGGTWGTSSVTIPTLFEKNNSFRERVGIPTPGDFWK